MKTTATGKLYPIVFAFFTLFTLNFKAQAQLEKNTANLGLAFDGNISSVKGAANTNIDLRLDLRLGYFIQDGLNVGLKFPLGYLSGAILNSDQSFLQIGLSPFIQYYPGKPEGPVSWYILAESGFYFLRNSSLEAIAGPPIFRKRSATDWFISGGLGLNFFFNDKVALDALLAGQYTNNISGDFFFEYPDLSLKIGLIVFLSRK
ncbi:MAG: outer membrane beta-barrel protein [Bacteroidota bacterium]